MQIYGEIAIVTGASSGIGAETAKALAARGARVVLLARRKDALDKVAGDIRSNGGIASAYAVDLSDPKAVARIAEAVKSEVGVPGILVNNAGSGVWRFIDETSPDEAVAMMALPYFAAFYVTRAFLPEMLRRKQGFIVNVNSPASQFTWPGASAYTAARWALRGFTESLRSDLYGTSLRVMHFVAGHTRSGYWQANPGSEERVPKIAKLVPTLTSQQAAAALVRGIEQDRRQVVVPFMLRLFYIQHLLFPWAVEWMLRVTGYRRR